MLDKLCTPSIVYLVYSIAQVLHKIHNLQYSSALIEMIIAVLFALLLNYLCYNGMEVISWIIIFIPFLFMSVTITALLSLFGSDPNSGHILINGNQPVTQSNAQLDHREIIRQLVQQANSIQPVPQNSNDTTQTNNQNLDTNAEPMTLKGFKNHVLNIANF